MGAQLGAQELPAPGAVGPPEGPDGVPAGVGPAAAGAAAAAGPAAGAATPGAATSPCAGERPAAVRSSSAGRRFPQAVAEKTARAISAPQRGFRFRIAPPIAGTL